jgi:hypothetical protein
MPHLKSVPGRMATRLILLLSLSLWTLNPALAGNSCKGLSKSTCEGSASCSWVSGYTTKDGAKVSAYCRAKARKSSGTGSKTSKGKTQTSKTSKGKTDTKKASGKKGSDNKKKGEKHGSQKQDSSKKKSDSKN